VQSAFAGAALAANIVSCNQKKVREKRKERKNLLLLAFFAFFADKKHSFNSLRFTGPDIRG